MMTVYDMGDVVRVQATITVSGVKTDPDSPTFQVRDPSGTIQSMTTSQLSVGVWYADVPVSISGTWYYRFSGTGAAAGAAESYFYVRPSAFV